MCDCYTTECEKKGCKETLPIHIADYNFPRTSVQVFCSKHLPKRKVTIFEVTKKYESCKDDICKKIGLKCAIRLCKGRIEPDSVGVCPNINNYCKTYYLE